MRSKAKKPRKPAAGQAERPEPGEAIYAELGLEAGPEHLARDLDGQWGKFESDPTTTTPAFQALNLIAAATWIRNGKKRAPFGGIDPQSFVRVPWWVVNQLTRAWCEYVEKHDTTTVGQAFGLEGRGQGKNRRVPHESALSKARKIALEVEWAKGQGMTLENAIANVAGCFGMSEDTVKGYWKKHHRLARERIKLWSSQGQGQNLPKS